MPPKASEHPASYASSALKRKGGKRNNIGRTRGCKNGLHAPCPLVPQFRPCPTCSLCMPYVKIFAYLLLFYIDAARRTKQLEAKGAQTKRSEAEKSYEHLGNSFAEVVPKFQKSFQLILTAYSTCATVVEATSSF